MKIRIRVLDRVYQSGMNGVVDVLEAVLFQSMLVVEEIVTVSIDIVFHVLILIQR
jgi:hypothetical protein